MRGGGFGASRRPRSSAIRVVLVTLVLLTAMAVLPPAPGRADTGYAVLLVHGAIGSPADFNQMIGWLIVDGYRPYTVISASPGSTPPPIQRRSGPG